MTRTLPLAAALLLAAPAAAQTLDMEGDPEAGRAAAQQCAACHGEAGVSVSSDIPNLAAQKVEYLQAQLLAFRAGERSDELMNAVAAQLADADIADLAAHFSSLPGAGPDASGELVPELTATRPGFPADWSEQFTKYDTISFPDRGQVRHYYANDAALEGARGGGDLPDGAYLLVEIREAELDDAGDPVRGEDGEFVGADLAAFTAMEKSAGWGEPVPGILRNGDWRYAVFSPEGDQKAGVNEAPCLACHKPLDSTDYVFSYDALKAEAGR